MPAHRHLQHQHLGVGGRREDRQRQADLGVEVLGAGVDPARQQRAGDVLDRGLAGRAGDPDHRAAELAPPGARERLQRQRAGRRRRTPSRAGRSAASERGAIASRRPPPRRRRRAPPRRTRRRRRARRGGRRRGRPAAASRESITARRGVAGPPARRDLAADRRRRSAPGRARSRPGRRERRSSSRATSRSSKGILRPPSNSWPCSWPLPAITTVSPGSAAAQRQRDRRPPVGLDLDLAAPPAPIPARISAMIASGSSERGLSEVTTARSASRAAISPICGRLSRSRSPPQPKTQISRRPAGELAGRDEHVLERVGRVRVVDEDRERLALVDRLEPPRHPLGLGQRRGRGLRARPRAPTAQAIAPSAFATLKWPGSGSSTGSSPSAVARREARAGGVERAGRAARRSARSSPAAEKVTASNSAASWSP